MIDLRLDESHDLQLVNGDLVLSRNADEVIQNVKIRLLTMRYEWAFNPLLGIQWIDSGGMFDPKVPQREKELAIRETILTTPGVLQMTAFEFQVDPINQAAQVDFTARTIYGEIDLEVTI